MLAVPRYSHHHHTGRLRPHRETSYGLLLFVLLLSGIGVMGVSAATSAASSNASGGTLNTSQLTEAAVISLPASGQTFQANPITVSGTCPERTLVKLFKNKVFAGSVPCDESRKFSLQMDLVIGSNSLTAQAMGASNKTGLVSAPVGVTLNGALGGPGFSTELVLQSTSSHRSVLASGEVVWPIEILGGQAPYAVSFDWGDKNSDLVTRMAPGPFTQKHTYTKAGGYLGAFATVMRATDAAQHTAYLQLTTIVTDPVTAAGSKTGWFNAALIWPVLGGLVLMVVSFWLGERREKGILQKRLTMMGQV